MQDTDKIQRDEIYSIAVKAGKRTYFFDVKQTRNGDYYLTLTESKKVYDREGNFKYEKHKLFLYEEDFDKFSEALNTSISYIKEIAPEVETEFSRTEEENETDNSKYSNLDFEDLGSSSDKDE